MRPTVKVLYMSGYADNVFVHNGTIDEGTHFIGKPFTPTELTSKVREVLDCGSNNHADVYEQAVNTSAGTHERPLNKAALQVLPEDILARLRTAVTAARYNDIVELIETIRATEPDLAIQLRRMVEAFDYDTMRALWDR